MNTMKRRRFNQLLAMAAGQVALFCSPLALWIRPAGAREKRRVLSADTNLKTLLFEDPADLDPRNLPVTPIDQFGTMGVTDHEVDLSAWRLKIGGAVSSPRHLDLAAIKGLPVLEKKVLLICPGVFAFHAKWTGTSLGRILKTAGVNKGATHVTVTGAGRHFPKTERFTLEEIRADAVFLAYGVNDRPLPQKHGFPLRIVAGDHVGDDWVKYADAITVEIDQQPAKRAGGGTEPAFLP
jgi:sulfoxide reductase catalytic subunit YedY